MFRANRDRVIDRGSASIELAILAPAVLGMFAMVLIGGRVNLMNQTVEAAAFDGARSASLARDAGSAEAAGAAAARSRIEEQGLTCTEGTPPVTVDTSGFGAPVGTPAQITVTVTCTVSFADVAFPGMPGGHTFTASFVSPLDTYRGRS